MCMQWLCKPQILRYLARLLTLQAHCTSCFSKPPSMLRSTICWYLLEDREQDVLLTAGDVFDDPNPPSGLLSIICWCLLEDRDQDVLLLAGDVSDDLNVLANTLRTLRATFSAVFFVPGASFYTLSSVVMTPPLICGDDTSPHHCKPASMACQNEVIKLEVLRFNSLINMHLRILCNISCSEAHLTGCGSIACRKPRVVAPR